MAKIPKITTNTQNTSATVQLSNSKPNLWILLNKRSNYHYSSIQSIEWFKNGIERLINHVTRQIDVRSRQQIIFKTKIGYSLRQNMLGLFREINIQVRQIYQRMQHLSNTLHQRQAKLIKIIKNADPLIKQIHRFSYQAAHQSLLLDSASNIYNLQQNHNHKIFAKNYSTLANTHDPHHDDKPQKITSQTIKNQSIKPYYLNRVSNINLANYFKQLQQRKTIKVKKYHRDVNMCLRQMSNMKIIQQRQLVDYKQQQIDFWCYQKLSLKGSLAAKKKKQQLAVIDQIDQQQPIECQAKINLIQQEQVVSYSL